MRAGKLRRALRARGVPDSSIPINPPSTDPKLDTLCRKICYEPKTGGRKNLLRTQYPCERAIFRDRPIGRSRVSKTTIFAPCAASPPSSSQLRATDQQERREKCREKCVTFKMSEIFFRAMEFFKLAALGNRTSQSFQTSRAPEKCELLFQACLKT